MMSSATRTTGANNAPGAYFAPKKDSTERKRRFSAAIYRYSNKQIAEIADCSVETVKNWRAERQLPQADHLFALAAMITEVHSFVTEEIGAPARDANAAIGALQQLALAGSPHESAVARAVLTAINQTGGM